MPPADKRTILQEIPLFASLCDEERDLISSRCSFQEYKKGDIIYREGDPADAFYCVVLGRVLVFTQAQDESETHLEYLHRGKYFGIISLLTGDTHSVTNTMTVLFGSPVMEADSGEIYQPCMNSALKHMDTISIQFFFFLLSDFSYIFILVHWVPTTNHLI